MLNSGDVPGMFAQDEKDRVAADIRDWAHEHGYASSKEACYTAFIDRVRENLHIVLTMSPVGESFRNRCRQFPSLINCCTIDWYTQWPQEALLSVSTQVSRACLLRALHRHAFVCCPFTALSPLRSKSRQGSCSQAHLAVRSTPWFCCYSQLVLDIWYTSSSSHLILLYPSIRSFRLTAWNRCLWSCC